MDNLLSLDKLIHLQNPWFNRRGDLPSERFLAKRAYFRHFQKLAEETKQISALIGVRRVGKTVMMRQLLAKKLEDSSSLPLYFSFDQELLRTSANPLAEIIDYYLTNILRQKPHKISRPVWLFLDEIQLVPFWQDIIKRYYDLNQNFKFIISGSSSLFLREGSQESLAGRIFEQTLPPLSFSEYQKITKAKDIDQKIAFEKYLQFGGFFEELELDDQERKKEFLREWVLGKVLERDLPVAFRLTDTQILKILFQVILQTAGQNIVLSKIGAELELSTTTVGNYINIFEKTLLLASIFNLAGSFVRRERRMRKIYPAASDFLSFLPIFPANFGAMAEIYVFNQLKQKFGREIFFYRQRGLEVDFLIPSKKLAIEVKYQEKIHPADYKDLRLVMKKKKYDHGLLLTRSLTGQQNVREGTIIFLPVSLLEDASL